MFKYISPSVNGDSQNIFDKDSVVKGQSLEQTADIGYVIFISNLSTVNPSVQTSIRQNCCFVYLSCTKRETL
jgi:hypothetical protein